MMRQVLINDVTYDIYFREINRYGGKEIIEFCEKIFFKDSLTVEKILSYYDWKKCFKFWIRWDFRIIIEKNIGKKVDAIYNMYGLF